MSKTCDISEMTVDYDAHSDIVEVERYDGTKEFTNSSDTRVSGVNEIFCGSCGDYIYDGRKGVNGSVRHHLEQE